MPFVVLLALPLWLLVRLTALSPTESDPHPIRRLYPIPEVAQALALTPKHVWRLVYSGQLKSVKLGRRRLVPAPALDDFIAGLADDRKAAQA